MKKLAKSDYKQLVEDCRAILTERSFNARMEIIEGYHELGERIVNDPLYQPRKSRAFLHRVAKDLGIADRTIYYAVAFYKKFPQLDKVPGGKNISWRQIRIQYLTSGKRKGQKKKEEKKQLKHIIVRCPRCGHRFTVKIAS